MAECRTTRVGGQRLRPIGALLLALAGCTTVQPVPGHPDALAAIEDYYRQHAWEDGARCLLPRMNITRVDVQESSPERLVAEVRYYWRDERHETDTSGNICNGFATRTFTLSQGRVVDMTGEQRP
jgi:hypothetical protein